MEVSGKVHASANLFQRKKIRWLGVWVGLQASLDSDMKRNATADTGNQTPDIAARP